MEWRMEANVACVSAVRDAASFSRKTFRASS